MSTSVSVTVRYLGDEPLTVVLATGEVYRFETGDERRDVHSQDLELFRELPQFEINEGTEMPE